MRKTVYNGKGAFSRIKAMRHSNNLKHQRAALALAVFLTVPRTEGAFFIAFWGLDPYDRKGLEEFWGITDDWYLFRRVCRFFGT